MTSNVAIGNDDTDIRQELQSHFKPEFLNRIDDIIRFHSLGRDEISRIIDLQIEGLQKHLEDRKIRLELTPAALAALFREGYDPTFGARPLKRAIQTMISNPLSLKLLEGEIPPGSRVVGDARGGGGLRFDAQPASQTQPAGVEV